MAGIQNTARGGKQQNIIVENLQNKHIMSAKLIQNFRKGGFMKIFVIYQIWDDGCCEYTEEIIKAYKQEDIANAYMNYLQVKNKDYKYKVVEITVED